MPEGLKQQRNTPVNLTIQRIGRGRTKADFPWAKTPRRASRGRINDGQVFNPVAVEDLSDEDHSLTTLVLAIVMITAVLIVVAAIVIGIKFRRKKIESRPDPGPPTVVVPRQNRINKFLSGQSVDVVSICRPCQHLHHIIYIAIQQIVRYRIGHFRLPAA